MRHKNFLEFILFVTWACYVNRVWQPPIWRLPASDPCADSVEVEMATLASRLIGRMCLAGCVVALSSCGKAAGQREVFPTTGELFIQGEPAEGATVAFHPTTGSIDEWPQGYPHAKVEAGGKFSMSTYGDKDGCPPGTYRVVVFWKQSPPEGEDVDEEAETVDRLGGRYASAESSQAEVTVNAEPTTLSRIDLK